MTGVWAAMQWLPVVILSIPILLMIVDCHGVMLNLLMTFNQEVPKFQIGGFHTPWPKSAIKS